MKYALVNDEKIEATPRQQAKCLCWGNDVISKCGELKLWHWAHAKNQICDDWYEPETEWHRDWKFLFGKEHSEVIIKKEGKKHIADVLTWGGVVIELQNSPISTSTIREREEFYGEKMIWVINSEPFSENIFVSKSAPIHHSFLPENLFYSEELTTEAGWFLDFEDVIPDEKMIDYLDLIHRFKYLEELNKYFKKGGPDLEFRHHFLSLIHNFNRENMLVQTSENTRYFTWTYARKSWTEAKRPVFIDFNTNALLWVKRGLGTKYEEGVLIRKETFVNKYKAK